MTISSDRVESLVRLAHRRRLTIAGAKQAAIGASLIFAGIALVLITGTQLLSWFWVATLAVAGLALSIFRLRQRLPDVYETAQLLDSHLALQDTISTAWHVMQHADLASSAPGKIQLMQAEVAAERIDPKPVFPLPFRPWAIPLALGVVAFALFTARYLVDRKLDFSRPLLSLHVDQLRAVLRGSAKAEDRTRSTDAATSDATEEPARSTALAPEAKMSDVDGQRTSNPSTAQEGLPPDMAAETKPDGKSDGGKGDGAAEGQSGQAQGKLGSGKDLSNSSTKQAEADTSQHQSGSEPQSGANHSLMSRMKDAMSSLMAKMKASDNSQRSSQASARKAAGEQDQSEMESNPSQNETSATQSQQSRASMDAKNGQQGQAREMSQPSPSQSASNSDRPSTDQAKSGIGRQDGGKDVKAVEEQRAMGKLAEIIGRRSQDVSGEMTVEAPSGKQQLRTAYTGKVSSHSDTGGEINRDEIPVEYQDYIRQYMERMHHEAKSPAK